MSQDLISGLEDHYDEYGSGCTAELALARGG